MHLEDLGVLSPLPKVELAKLIGESAELTLHAGNTVPLEEGIYFICSGTLEVWAGDLQETPGQPLLVAGPGEVIGEWSLTPVPVDDRSIYAVRDAVLIKLTADHWQTVITRHPEVGMRFQKSVLHRLQETQRVLVRYRRHLDTYASELWTSDHTDPVREIAAGTAVLHNPKPVEVQQPEEATGGRESEAPARPMRKRMLGFWGITVLFGGVIAGSWIRLGFHGAELWIVSAILGWTAVNWYLALIPDYAVALTAALLTTSLGFAGPSETFGGFADPSWFLILGAFGLGAAIQRSGLLYRVALNLLRVLPPTYAGQATALALAGTLLTPCLPSVQSRVALAGLLSRELSEAMQFRRHSKGATGMAMSAFLGFAQMRFLFLNGSSYSLLAWGLLPMAIRKQASWAQWFWVALPLGFVVLVVTHLITVFWLYRENGASVSRTAIDRQLVILGRMSRKEKLTMWVTLAVVLGFVLQPLHHVDASWVALLGFLVLVITGILDKEMVLNKIDWQYMLFYGSLAGLVTLISKSKLSSLLAGIIVSHLGPVASSAPLFLIGLGLLTILLRLALQPGPAVILLGATFFPFASSLGFNPLTAAVVVVAASTTWLIPQLLSSYTTLHATTQGRCFDHRQVQRLAWIHSLILLGAIALSVPYWSYMGLLSAH